jgi:hypothetical protein
MATSQATPNARGRRTGDRGALSGAEPPTDPTPTTPHHAAPGHPDAAANDIPDPANPHENTPGHPDARGTLPMARYLTDLAIEDEIQALAAEAPLPTVYQAARLARLLRISRPHRDRAA